jgi:Holliday junction resolvase
MHVLAKKLGREKCNLCCKAKELGLTNKIHPHNWSRWNKTTKDEAEIMFSQFKKSSLGLNQYCEKFSIPLSGFTKTMKRFFPDEWDSVIELKTLKQSRYRLGRHVEYTVRDAFKALGYLVFRSPQSRGITDLVAIDKGIIVFIQCKRGMTIGVKEWNCFYQTAQSVNAVPLIAGRPTGRGIQYWLVVGEKDGSKKPQPKKDIKIEDVRNFTTTKNRE